MPRAMAVLRMEWPRKLALSNTMVVVSSVISLFAPPITPASATGLRVGNDEHAGREAWSLPSSVRRFALFGAADDDLAVVQAGVVERVHRLAVLEA